MLQALVSTARDLLGELNRSLVRPRRGVSQRPSVPPPGETYLPLERVLLTDGVGHTLFEEYAAHRAEARGEEETGWFLLGLREARQAIVLATLPAGTQRDASAAHVLFNRTGQAVGSLYVRQFGRRLSPLGVVHTHPGSLRHPSDGDFRGDSQWVRVLSERRILRGGDAVFGIGTADSDGTQDGLFVQQPRPHVQCLGELCLSWYSLRNGEPAYRPLPVGLTLGPDLARPLHLVWSVVEAHADRLERLFRQQAGVTFDVIADEEGPWLSVSVPLADPGDAVRVLLSKKQIRYCLLRGGDLLEAECLDERVDRGVYLMLAELAAQS